jgi:predicted transcriptional regulator
MKITRSIVLEKEMVERLEQLAEKRYTSVSAIIRQAIAKEIKRVEKKAVTN